MAATLTTTQRAGVIAHALHAIADHITAHHLIPGDIVFTDDNYLEIAISGCDATVWKASLGEGVDSVARRAVHPQVDTVTLRGRLPDTGVQVELTWVEKAPVGPRALQAVTR